MVLFSKAQFFKAQLFKALFSKTSFFKTLQRKPGGVFFFMLYGLHR